MNKILLCDCNSTEHQIVISHIEGENSVYCHIHLNSRPFLSRLKYGLKYIFGYKCKYGHWEEFIFAPEHVKELKEIIKILES